MCDCQGTNKEVGSGRSRTSSTFILHPSSIFRSAFTLVELLVVIVIIGILMGLITAAAGLAKNAARKAAIGVEITNLDMALKKYRDQFGEYPPDGTDQTYATFMRHLNRAFPRFVVGGSTPQAQFSNLNTQFNKISGISLSNVDPSGALVFFLGGWPVSGAYATSGNFSGQLVYFSSDPTDPFDIYATGYSFNPSTGATTSNASANNYAKIPTSRIAPLYPFDVTRLQTVSGLCQFYPNTGNNIGNTGNAPYIYFRATAMGFDYKTGNPAWGYNVTKSSYNNVYTPIQRWPIPSSYTTVNASNASFTGDAVYPYYQANLSGGIFQWYMPNDFQIICAGLDNRFGSVYSVPLDLGISPFPLYTRVSTWSTDRVFGFDNQTNFSSGTIENAK